MTGRLRVQVRADSGLWRTVYIKSDRLYDNLTILRAYGFEVRVCDDTV